MIRMAPGMDQMYMQYLDGPLKKIEDTFACARTTTNLLMTAVTRPEPSERLVMRRTLVGAVILSALLCDAPATAQEQHGAIEGVAQDAKGAALPGVTIQARNVSQGGAVKAVSDHVGVFRFATLAPGYYDVTATLAGFRSMKFDHVEVLLGQMKELTFTLEPAAVAEETLGIVGAFAAVVVAPLSPLVDIRQSARGFSLREDTIDLLPKGRDFTTLVTQAPSANDEPRLGGISIDGSSASENRFLIDGAETTNPQTGVSGQAILPEFVEEIQVKASGYTAEYGGSTGGVINVVTKSGTNVWRGHVLINLEGDALEGGPRKVLRLGIGDYVVYPEDRYTRIEPGFAIGGPLVRDRGWLFAAYQPALTHTERTVTFSFDESTATKRMTESTHFFSANHTAQMHDRLRTRVAFNWSPLRQNGLLPALDGSTFPTGNFDVVDKRQNYSVSGNADWLATSKLYIGTRAGYYMANHTNGNVVERPIFIFDNSNIGYEGVPESLQRVAGFRTDLDNVVSKVDRLSRVTMQVDGTYFGGFAGQHALKWGVQYDRRANRLDMGNSANVVDLNWDNSGNGGRYGTYIVQSNFVDPKRGEILTGDVNSTTVGLFVQDAWRIKNRLTLNLGLRTENEEVPFYDPQAAVGYSPIRFSFGDKLAPRVGAAWDVGGDGRWKIHGSWGIFYDIFKFELPRGEFGAGKRALYFFNLGTADWPNLLNSPDCPPECPGGPTRPPIDIGIPSFKNLDPALDPMRLQEATLGIEHQVSAHGTVAVRYVHKQVDQAVEDIGSHDANQNPGPTFMIGNPGYHRATEVIPGVPLPKAVRDYDAVEFIARRLLNRNWGATVSYVWSRLYGNYPGLSESDEYGRTSPNLGSLWDYPFMMFDQTGKPVLGPLPTDRPHQLKAQFVYTAPFGLNISVFQSAFSGIPVSRRALISADALDPNFHVDYYLGRGSDGRTTVLSQTDLNLQYVIKLGVQRRLALGLNVLNVFDQDAGIHKYQAEGCCLLVNERDFLAGRVNITDEFANHPEFRFPEFLKSQFFQAPIKARVEIRFSF